MNCGLVWRSVEDLRRGVKDKSYLQQLSANR